MELEAARMSRSLDTRAHYDTLKTDHVSDLMAVTALDTLVLVLVDGAVQQSMSRLGAAGAGLHGLLDEF